MKKATRDTEAVKDMPTPEGRIAGAIAGQKKGGLLKKARKLDVEGQKLRDKGEAMGPRKVDKAAVRARIDTKLADIRKRRGLAQQAQVKRPSTRDTTELQSHPNPGKTPASKPKAAVPDLPSGTERVAPKAKGRLRKAIRRGQEGGRGGTPEQQVRRGLKPKISSTTSAYRTAAGKATDALNR